MQRAKKGPLTGHSRSDPIGRQGQGNRPTPIPSEAPRASLVQLPPTLGNPLFGALGFFFWSGNGSWVSLIGAQRKVPAFGKCSYALSVPKPSLCNVPSIFPELLPLLKLGVGSPGKPSSQLFAIKEVMFPFGLAFFSGPAEGPLEAPSQKLFVGEHNPSNWWAAAANPSKECILLQQSIGNFAVSRYPSPRKGRLPAFSFTDLFDHLLPYHFPTLLCKHTGLFGEVLSK